MLLAWVLFPLVFVVTTLGCGLLVERLSGQRLPGVLLIPLGLAALIVTTQLTISFSWLASFSPWVVLLLAGVGFLLRRRTFPWHGFDWAAFGGAAGVFVIFAAPVVFSGEATFAGYSILGDTSIHFIGIDYLMEHGRKITGLAPSSYEYSLQSYFGNTAYPSGAHTPLGALRPLIGLDVAWVYQPYLALFAALLALCIYQLLRPVVPRQHWRALFAFIGAQPALVLAYSLQGSLKEMASVWVVALLVALLPVLSACVIDGRLRLRFLLPLIVTTAAGMGIISMSLAPWLGPVLLIGYVIVLQGIHWKKCLLRSVIAGGFFILSVIVLAFPSFMQLGTFIRTTTVTVTSQSEAGNLLGPLSPWQMTGIWLAGDYRIAPASGFFRPTQLLIGLAVISGVYGLLWAVRNWRRTWGVLAFSAISLIGMAYVVSRGSIWANGKAYMIASPGVLTLALLGPAALLARGRRTLSGIGLLMIGGGVLFSNVLAYHDVSLAPKARLAELHQVGLRIRGQGPTLYTEFEEFGKHFLRAGDPESPSEGWQRRRAEARLRDGRYPDMGYGYDIDQFSPKYVNYYRTIVMRRSPSGGRPPAGYRLITRGDYYELWQRPQRASVTVVEHLPVSVAGVSSGPAACSSVKRLARDAQRWHGRLAFVERAQPVLLLPSAGTFSKSWPVDVNIGDALKVKQAGFFKGAVRVPAAAEYELWLGGSFGRRLTVALDGKKVGMVSGELNGRGQFISVGRVRLAAGVHQVILTSGQTSFRPGDGGGNRSFTGIQLTPVDDSKTVQYIVPKDYKQICGRRVDWLEVVH